MIRIGAFPVADGWQVLQQGDRGKLTALPHKIVLKATNREKADELVSMAAEQLEMLGYEVAPPCAHKNVKILRKDKFECQDCKVVLDMTEAA